MSYQVLARKWRPQNFKEMVGQEHVLRALINALDSDRLHHAYLFTGTRGVGKTTIARILAKCLNCETGVTSEPCGTCNSCKEIVAGNFLDLIEVDAASRTKVEDTRELLDNVQYAPTRGRYKVYLIDEVHMLTGHSFNALLKTLEEPPPHVKFLFATTDPQKLPVTILSRCLQFNLKRMPVDMISGHLEHILEQEKTPFDQGSLRLIARAADGSMRDALSLLDQSIAFGGNALKENDVREMLGTISHEPLIDLLKAVSAGEGAAILQQVEDLAGVTPDFEAAADALISLLHQLAVQQVVPEAVQDDDSVTALANDLSKEDVQLFYQIALQGRRDLPLSPDPRSGFEMILLRMMSFRPLREGMQLQNNVPASTASTTTTDSADSKKKTISPEQSSQNKPVVTTPTPAVAIPPVVADNTDNNGVKRINSAKKPTPVQSQNTATAKQTSPPWETLPNELDVTQPMPSAVTAITTATQLKTAPAADVVSAIAKPEQIEQVQAEPKSPSPMAPERDQKSASKSPTVEALDSNQWHTTIPQLSLTGRAAELIKHCLLERQESGMISLLLDSGSEGLLADSIKDEIQSALSQHFGESIRLNLSVSADQAALPQSETLAQRSQREQLESQQQAEQNIAGDPFVIELKNRFGAQVVPGSVQPKS